MDNINDCGILIKQIHDAIGRKANNELRESGLTLSQLRYLEYMDMRREEGVPLKDFERYFKVAQATVVGIMKRLAAKEFIYLTQDERDQRVKIAYLTDMGRQLFEESRKNRGQMEELILKPLNQEEREAFLSALKKICGSLKES